MNSVQALCVLCSKINECAVELECLRFCDPGLVLTNLRNFKTNGVVVLHLYRTVYPSIVEQNECNAMSLTLYIQVLLKSVYKLFMLMDRALGEFYVTRDYDRYFFRVLQLGECKKHMDIDIFFNDNIKQSVSLHTLNDIERLLCKLNYVFGIIQPDMGLHICKRLLCFLGNICGCSVVANPEIFVEKGSCIYCYEELSLIPNQGKSIHSRLNNKICEHVTLVKDVLDIESGIDVIEKDLAHYGELHADISDVIKKIKEVTANKQTFQDHIDEAERTLNSYNVFTDIPDHIYSLSDFTYWSKTAETIVKTVAVTVNQLNSCHAHYKELQDKISRYFHGCGIHDIFLRNEKVLKNDERLFTGSLYASPCRIVNLITSMSLRNMEDHPIFIKMNNDDDLRKKIKYIVDRIQDKTDSQGDTSIETTDNLLRSHDLLHEVKTRKKMYSSKLAETGYSKITQCIQEQELRINKLINVNIVGSIIYDMLSKLMNGFIKRRKYLEVQVNDISDLYTHDDHLYIKNNLIHKKLSAESIPDLGQKIYHLLIGPVITHHRDTFPLPFNIDMAYSCDNANILPHVKENLVKCIESNIGPGQWMVSSYNGFFDFSDSNDINEMQRKMWLYVKELVFGVALYNDIFNQSIQVYRVDEVDETMEGIILTYNCNYPLLLNLKSKIYKSSDLYLLFYCIFDSAKETSSETVRCVRRTHKRVCLRSLVRDDSEQSEFIPDCFID